MIRRRLWRRVACVIRRTPEPVKTVVAIGSGIAAYLLVDLPATYRRGTHASSGSPPSITCRSGSETTRS